MSEWKEIELGQYVEILSSKRIFAADYVPKGIPFFRSKEVIERALGQAISNPLYITEKRFQDIKSKFGSPIDGDILLSAVGERAGIPYLVNNEGDFYFKDGNLIWFRKFSNKLNSEYLVYFFKSRIGQFRLENLMIGSAQKALTIIGLKGLFIPIPGIEQQIEIAKTLFNLDQKITLLRQQNLDLEELAQTLFKRWFVEFEFPNENGEPYKSSDGKMVESELGEIPEGWRVGDVSNHVKHSTVSTSPCKQPRKEFFHYSIPAYDNGRFPTVDLGTTILSNKYLIVENSILVSKLNPSTSRIWPILTVKPNAVCSTEIQVFIPKKDRYSFSFGLFHYQGVKNEMAQRASGTSSSHQRVRPGDILNIECIVPDNNVLELFEVTALRLLTKVEENHEEIQTLIQLRDTLLPKLMSGELRVNI